MDTLHLANTESSINCISLIISFGYGLKWIDINQPEVYGFTFTGELY